MPGGDPGEAQQRHISVARRATVPGVDVEKARSHLYALQGTLLQITQQDMEQEVQGIALPVLDTVLAEVRALIPGSPVLRSVRDVVSPELIEDGGQVRAVDLLLVVGQMLEALPPQPPARFDRRW